VKKASTAAVENGEDKAKQKYPGTVRAMKPTACKGEPRPAFRDKARKHC